MAHNIGRLRDVLYCDEIIINVTFHVPCKRGTPHDLVKRAQQMLQVYKRI